MDMAALIISVFSLMVSLVSLIWILAKQFSTHNIQMVPVDPFSAPYNGMVGAKTSPIGDDFKELGDPLSEDEQEYFNKLNAKK